MDLLTSWILYAVFGVSLFALIFLWAVRAGQFRDQDRARHLPLQDDAAADKEPSCKP